MPASDYYNVDKILKHKWINGWNFLTSWENFPLSSSTWEPLKHFRIQGDQWNEVLLEYLKEKDLMHIISKQKAKKDKEQGAKQESTNKVSFIDAKHILSNVAVRSLAHPHKPEEVATTRPCARETPSDASSPSFVFLGSERPHEESVGGALGTAPSRFSLPSPFSLFASQTTFPSIQHHVVQAITTPSSGGVNATISHPPSIEGSSPFPRGLATGGDHLSVSSTTHNKKAPFM